MPDQEVTEFLVVSIPDKVEPGTTLRVISVLGSLVAAKKAVTEAPSGVTGRVAVLQRRALYDRRPTIESIELEAPIVA